MLTPNLKKSLLTIAVLGGAFQVGHFIEHATQAWEWLFGDRSHSWMSSLAMWLSMQLGPMPLGMELLHLTGNLIFFATLGAMLALKDSKWLNAAFLVEGFHLSEHLMLTLSVALTGHPFGWSTGFGLAEHWPRNAAVGYRVLWHFTMNLIPTALMVWSVIGRRFRRAQNTHTLDNHVDFEGNFGCPVPMSR